jgi:hypothetical protein
LQELGFWANRVNNPHTEAIGSQTIVLLKVKLVLQKEAKTTTPLPTALALSNKGVTR